MQEFRCPKCKTLNSFLATQCVSCGVQFAYEQPTQIQTASVLQIDCQACRTPGSMFATKIPRFSDIVRFIGFVLLVPSFLGLGFAGLMILSAIMSGSAAPSPHSDAEAAGMVLGYLGVLLISIILFFTVGAFFFGAVSNASKTPSPSNVR